MTDPTILAFDTSGTHCAAALMTGGAIIATRTDVLVHIAIVHTTFH